MTKWNVHVQTKKYYFSEDEADLVEVIVKFQKAAKAAQKLTPRQKTALAHSIAINALQHIGEETYAPARNFDSDSYIQGLAKEPEKNLESVIAKHAEYKNTFSIRKSRNM